VKDEPDDVPERSVEVKGFRIDLIIALCALVVSSLATAAAVWQSHVVAQQLSSQVWPYVAFQTTYDKTAVTETISNEGLGPARVRWIRLLLDGKVQHTLVETMHTLLPGTAEKLTGSFSDLSPGHVMRVGGSAQLFRITNPTAIAAIVKNYQRMQIEACYCPIIDGNCWITRSGGPGVVPSDPQTVASCPDYVADMLTSGVGP
jgi:hypothetical protein